MYSSLFSTVLAQSGRLAVNIPPFDVNSLPQPPGYAYNTLADLLATRNAFGPIAIIFFVAGALLLINIILAGFALMTSAGDPQGVGAAKQRLTNSVIGLVLVFTAYFIVQIVGLVLNLPGITNEFK